VLKKKNIILLVDDEYLSLTCNSSNWRPVIWRGGSFSLRYFTFSSSRLAFSCSNSSMALWSKRI